MVVEVLPLRERTLGEGVRRVLDRVVIRPLAVRRCSLELAEDAFIDALHEGLGPAANHFGYRIMFGVHLLDGFRRHVGGIGRLHRGGEALRD